MKVRSQITCTRRIQFCAGHRVLGHENKCAHPHGHNYIVYLTASAPQLDELGRVVDFSVLKQLVGGWIDKFWDHGFIIYEKDEELVRFYNAHNYKNYLLPYNPTAENMADYILLHVGPRVLNESGLQLVHVKIYETENCFAEAALRGGS